MRTNRRSTLVFRCVLLIVACASLAAVAAGPTGGLVVTDVTLITGRPDMFNPGTRIANLDAGDLVAGITAWETNSIVFLETRVGFLWSPVDGASVFEIPFEQYLDPNLQVPEDISATGAVVGWNQFKSTLVLRPFLFTVGDGFVFLPFPKGIAPKKPQPGPGPAGLAVAISEDGEVAVGHVRKDGPFSDVPTQATAWTITRKGRKQQLRGALLEGDETWSNAWDVSADGLVVVGDAGPAAAQTGAVRWTDGSLVPLEAVGSSSSARFASADGSVAIGVATVGGQEVLVRWDANGAALAAAPPLGLSVKQIHAINPTGTAAAGVLAAPDPTKPFGENWAPFVWTEQDGLVVLPELGREQDYDLSSAFDVSDDGDVVAGVFQASVIFEGDPPSLAFLWLRGTGVILVNDLMEAAGFVDPDYFGLSAVSGDGLRILATGNPPDRTVTDTNSVIIRLARE